jgi:hypothetical protein
VVRLDFSSMAKNEMLKSPMEKVMTSETKEIGSQNLGSKPYQNAFLNTSFIHLYVHPTESTKFWNNYRIISILKDRILGQTSSF